MRRKKGLLAFIITALAAGIAGAFIGSKYEWNKDKKKFIKRA